MVELGGDGDDGAIDLLAEEGLGDLLHLGEDHGGDLLRGQLLDLAPVADDDHGLIGGARDDLEGLELHVLLDGGSEKRRPMRCLALKTVFSRFTATWFLVASLMRRSASVKATCPAHWDDVNAVVEPDIDAAVDDADGLAFDFLHRRYLRGTSPLSLFKC
ncbi:hypothetical protein ACLOJK_025106 [Asimina triloba]